MKTPKLYRENCENLNYKVSLDALFILANEWKKEKNHTKKETTGKKKKREINRSLQHWE